jgi:hypothetical protein
MANEQTQADRGAEVIARLINEYSMVTVLLDRAAGPRLVLRAERTGDEVSLDAVVLEALASLDPVSIRRLVAAFSESERAGDAVVEPGGHGS